MKQIVTVLSSCLECPHYHYDVFGSKRYCWDLRGVDGLPEGPELEISIGNPIDKRCRLEDYE